LPGKPFVPEYPPETSPSEPRKRLLLAFGLLALALACLALTVSGFNLARGRLAALRPGETNIPTEISAATPAAIIPTTVAPTAAAPTSAASSTPSPTLTASPTNTPAPTLTPSPVLAPTLEPVAAECEQGYLFALGRIFVIQILAPPLDGVLRLPQGDPEAAYFLEGGPQPNSGSGYAFWLDDTPENLSLLDSNRAGEPVSILWRGCLLEEATLLGVQRASADQPPAYDPFLPGVTLLVVESGPQAQALPSLPPASLLANPQAKRPLLSLPNS
jgi:hypothetical protein